MEDIAISTLGCILIVLVFLSAFFSGSEIGMMSINRYRLRHLVRQKIRAAIRVDRLVQKPDRLLGVILIGNTIANIVASSLATIIGQRLYGNSGMAIATMLLTIIILVFAEMVPKTLAAFYPEKVAFKASLPLKWLLALFSPLVRLVSYISNTVLSLFNVKVYDKSKDGLSGDELRTVVREAGSLVSHKHKSMLLSILDLDTVTVDDIMVPRSELFAIDLSQDWDDILSQLETAQHTRVVLFDGDFEHVKGTIHMRSIVNLLAEKRLSKETLREVVEKPYFVLEGTGLYKQLQNFQEEKKRICFIVDEHHDLQGLVTLEDILEEIVGEFTTDMASMSKDVVKDIDGSYIVDAQATIRDLNRGMSWQLPQLGPKTLNGLITEKLGFIPPAYCCLKIEGYPIEILQVTESRVRIVRIRPPFTQPEEQ